MSKMVIGIGNNKNGRSYNNKMCGQKKGKVIKRASFGYIFTVGEEMFPIWSPLREYN